ncbi:MAG: hypothetical protein E7412_00010 [Ruminococcaceae bacterium]|nr:hypothetical protein [Oscillospiraceae bacterium]
MHDTAVEHKLNKYVSVCGGGGKDVFNQMSCKRIFSRGVIYNEFEKGLYCLITALKDYKNIDKINAGIDELLKTYSYPTLNRKINGVDKHRLAFVWHLLQSPADSDMQLSLTLKKVFNYVE